MAENKDELPVLPEPTLLGTEVSGHVLECYGHTDAAMRAYATEACAVAQSRINALLEEVEGLRKDAATLAEALSVYADPSFYHACAFMFDRPTGGFDEDFSFDDGYDSVMPGKHARETLASLSSGRAGSGEVSNG